jgi:hypothetical protein
MHGGPVSKPRDQWTAEDWWTVTEGARRRTRFKFAATRIQKVVDAMPPFTKEELYRQAVLLRPDPGRAANRKARPGPGSPDVRLTNRQRPSLGYPPQGPDAGSVAS